ncbi:hypothetical protein F5Y06DRAFT_260838 [Hypoxylon sp. FL0890]|nr:hypothetical protein F5Y06DRAFT_260838 [Hypoxylon sp. FL0890]
MFPSSLPEMMDRDSPKSPRVLTTKPNGNANGNGNGRSGRTSTQPFGNRRASKKDNGKPEHKETVISDTDTSPNSRHPLYSSPKYIPGSNSFSASANRNSESPRETRIPLPKYTGSTPTSPTQQNQLHSNLRNKPGRFQTQSLDMRQPMSFRSAFALAQKQEADDQLDDTFSIKHAFNMASAEMNGRIDGSPSPAPRSMRRQSYSAIPQRALTSAPNSDLGQHLRQFDRNHQLGTGNGPLRGLFGRSRIGPRVSETGNLLAKKASDGDLGGSPARRRSSQQGIDSKKEHTEAPKPIPSIEYKSASDDRASSTKRYAQPSPEKNYNWQLDADFTAGDLQVSDSPRIRTDQSNGKSSRRTSSAASSPVNGTPNMRRSNNRLDQIRQKEIEAANAVLPEEDVSSRPTNSRLDEVRAREMVALSKRAVATSRLDEIRIRNSEARSESPETGRNSSREELRGSSLQLEDETAKTPENKAVSGTKGEPTSDTPPTVLRSMSDHKLGEASKEKIDDINVDNGKKGVELRRNDSHDLLQRLARATSASPPSEKTNQEAVPDDALLNERSDSRENSRSRSTREERKSRNLEVKNLEVKSSRERPTVGFAGLRRIVSSDSIKEKRASLPGSEADPLDRIEGELRLFAPLDNYSEKGSVRAPSPIPSEPAEEETPRPSKVDPLTQPTPKVTGAYVETPATIKIKQESHSDDRKVSEVPNQLPAKIPELRSRSSGEVLNGESIKQEDSDAKTLRSTSAPRSSSVPTAPRRGRSASRRRRPLRPLINTAKPPSVKEDIRAILRMNDIDDSTLEDFDSILADQEINDEELQKMVNDTMGKIDDDLDFPGLSERDSEIEVIDRLSKSLKTGLLGIRSAKKGIERLEDKVTHTEHKADQAHTDLNASSSKSETHIPASPNASGPVLLAVPALYRKSPKLRPTRLGVLALTVFVWYILESIFCILYTTEYNCTPQLPCVWSPNEPYFPYAMPFMLDEWTTGGKGRALTWKIGEEVGDIFADVSDWVMNRDLTQYDERYMDVWQRKRHRRRLRKRGLTPKWVPPPGYKPRFAEWNAARLAREAAEQNGYEGEDETMSADEMV